MKKRILSIVLTLCMVLTLFPTVAFAEGTGNKNIMLGTSGISGYSDTDSYDYIYYGTRNNSPINWRVLDDQTNTGGSGLFLFSDEILGNLNFDNTRNPTSSAWQGSDAQKWCTEFYNTNLTEAERQSVVATTKSDVEFISQYYSTKFAAAPNILSNDKVFFLSAEEAENESYGFTDTGKRAPYQWWLRSPKDESQAGMISVNGFVGFNRVTYAAGARPAFNLNTNTVLFISAAAGGKVDETVDGDLTAVDDYNGNEWKLTLKDTARNFTADRVACAGNIVTVGYSDAMVGTNEYISAIIVGNDDSIKYYGNVAKPESADGTLTIDLSSVSIASGDTLKIFSEQCNGDKLTDYASEPVAVSLEPNAYSINNTLTNVTTSNPATYRLMSSTEDYTATLSADSGNLLTDITVKIGGVQYTTITGGNSSANITIPCRAITGDIEIIASAIPQEATPTVNINYTAETLSTTTAMEYSKDSGANWTVCTENMAATDFGWTGAAAVEVQFRTKATDSSYASEPVVVTIPARPDAPTPTVKSKTYNSVTLEEIPDKANGAKAQYSMDGGTTWQDSPEFTGLSASTAYSFVARYGAIENSFASSTSAELKVTTSAVSSGGGSTYAITAESAKNGTVTVAPKTAVKGATVTITVEPDKGYTLETLTVTDKNGNEIELTNKGDGKYTFTMPASKVTVTATFMENNSMLNFFVDVFPGDYYYDAVLWAAENGITGGVDDTHFAPNAPCTRAQIVTFLWRAAGSPVVNYAMNFSDVPADAYYAEAVRWAVSQGITKGTGDTTFSPDATCTRAQAMAFIYRSEQARGGGMQGAWMFQNPFSDVDLENYYGEAVMWAVANGVTNGTSDTTFSPGADCTRAQIVTFLYRCLG